MPALSSILAAMSAFVFPVKRAASPDGFAVQLQLSGNVSFSLHVPIGDATFRVEQALRHRVHGSCTEHHDPGQWCRHATLRGSRFR